MEKEDTLLKPYIVLHKYPAPSELVPETIVIAKNKAQAVKLVQKRTADWYKGIYQQEPAVDSILMAFNAYEIDMNHPHIVTTHND